MRDFVVMIDRWVIDICQLLATFVISVGVVKSLIIFCKDALLGFASADAIRESRLELGHAFSLGLGFLIGASILHTTLEPTWSEMGQLVVIIVIRTLLNFFLLRDIQRDTHVHKPNRLGQWLLGLNCPRRRKDDPPYEVQEPGHQQSEPAEPGREPAVL